MFAIPVILALAAFIYLRPQEIVLQLQKVPFLYLFALLLPVAWSLDVRAGFVRLRSTPMLLWTLLFFGWSILTVFVKAPATAASETIWAGVSMLLFLAPSQGIQSFRGLRALGWGLLAITMVIAVVCLHQAFAPLGCVKQSDSEATDTLYPDGRPCETRTQCYEGVRDDNDVFLCERVGLLGTTSIANRVRYRGILQDPNETALVLSAGIPIAFALAATAPRMGPFLVPVTLIPVAMTIVFTKSRSGQLAFIAAIGVYFLRRLRWLGVLLAAPLAAPILLLGGRSSSEADESATERLVSWLEGIEMWRSSPLFGVGRGQFVEYHYLTAHNSFILALAETGFLGLFMWASVVYLAFKTTISLALSPETRDHRDIRAWSAALFASLCAITISSFFLSFSNHDIFWLFMGFVGALAATASSHVPSWKVRYRGLEMLVVAAGCALLVAAIFVYSRLKA